jgi:hypothetical protein
MQCPPRQAALGEDASDVRRESRVEQLGVRDVDGDGQRRALLPPDHKLLARGPQHELTEVDVETAVLGDQEKLARRQDAALRMIPAHESFEPSHATGRRLRSIR